MLIIIYLTLFVAGTKSEETKGQKAHFTLTDTPGSFKVHATQMLAKVSSQPDSVKIIVKPGMAKYPLITTPTEKPLVHVLSPAVVRPLAGWNYYKMIGRKKRSYVNIPYSKHKVFQSSGIRSINDGKTYKRRKREERKMEVKGGTGDLSVHVNKNETKVLTTTGAVQIFLKNPATKIETVPITTTKQYEERSPSVLWKIK